MHKITRKMVSKTKPPTTYPNWPALDGTNSRRRLKYRSNSDTETQPLASLSWTCWGKLNNRILISPKGIPTIRPKNQCPNSCTVINTNKSTTFANRIWKKSNNLESPFDTGANNKKSATDFSPSSTIHYSAQSFDYLHAWPVKASRLSLGKLFLKQPTTINPPNSSFASVPCWILLDNGIAFAMVQHAAIFSKSVPWPWVVCRW